jgi:hypothetical protein
MLRKILAPTLAVCTATLFMSADALAWGGGSWNRSGSASYTGRYGNSYSRSYSGSGSFSGGGYRYGGGGYGYGGGGYHYGGAGYGGGGGYYAGGFHPGSFVAGYAAGAYYSR